MNGILIKLRSWWEASDRTQKVITVGGGVLLLALLVGTFMVASKPKMAIVFANLSPGDAGSVQMEVESMGLPVTMDNGGNVSVPSDKVALVRARLAQSGKLPKATHPGYEGLTSMGMMNTPKVEEERLKSMLEGELATSVEQFDGVDSASVHLTFGENSPFASEQKEAAASVTLSERAGGTVSASEGKAMATLVASSVPGMDAKKVAVFSRDGRAIFDGAAADDASGAALTKLDLEKKESDAKRQELQEMLNKVVGPGNSIVTVRVGLDTDKSSRVEDSETPNKLPTEEQKTNEKYGAAGGPQGKPAEEVAGTQPGSLDNKTISTGADGYTMTQQHVVRPTDRIHTETEKGIGEVKSMAVTVFLNKPKADDPDAVKASGEKEEAVRRAVNTFLGLSASDPKAAVPELGQPMAFEPKDGFTSEIISYPFDDTAQKDGAKAASEQAGASRMNQIFSIIPTVILALLGIFVLKQLGKAASSRGPLLAFASGGYAALPQGAAGGSGASFASALPSPKQINVKEEIRQKALEAGISEEELNAAMAAAQEQGINVEDIPSIGKRINLPLEQIRKMGDERPEVVATLIKSWLLEDRR